MYNADRKERFIAENSMSLSRGWVVDVFNSIGPMELQLGKDLAEMTAEEVGRAICVGDVMASATITNRIPLVVRYKNWCAENGFSAVPIRSGDVVIDVSRGIRSTMVCSPSNLLAYLDRAYPDDGRKNTPRCVYRSFFWFLFSGLRPVEAADVRTTDVNLRRRLISYNNRWYRIFDLSVTDIRTACEQTVFEKPTPKGNKIMTRPREANNRVLRGWAHGDVQRTPAEYVNRTLRTAVQTAFDRAGLPGVSPLKVRKSGIFYDMLGRELKGLDVRVAFYTLASDDFDLDHIGKEISARQKHKAVHRIQQMYMMDYSNWKQAFEPELLREFGVETLPAVE